MQNTKDIIIQLKKVREEKALSYGKIIALMEKNGDFTSKSTLSRLFAEGSENETFNYESTIRPVANALLDIEDIEEYDTADTGAMKALLKYKMDRIEELKLALAEEENKYHEKLDAEREEYQRKVNFLMNQIELKDKRIDQLMEAFFTKEG